MTKLKTQIAATLAALSFAAVAGPASAAESLPARAATALGYVIAAQGDAALEQIRAEIKDNLQKLTPYLPQRSDAAAPPATATADADKQ